MTKKLNINKAVVYKALSLILLTLFVYLQNIKNVYAVGSTIGQQDTLVMLLNFQENPNDQPISVSEATALVFGEVNNFYQENSYGKTWFSGQVLGWYTLPLSNQVCDYGSLQKEADALALQEGVDVNSYQRIVYIISGSACLQGGMGTMDSLPTRAYINNTVSARVIEHELGHNLGLNHAKALDCGDVTLGSNCREIEAGDTYDIIGGVSALGYLNAFNKEQLGWINGTNDPKVQEVTSDGTYSLTHYESTDPNQTIVLKIPRGTTSANGLPEWFYIEYRQAIGYDQFLADRSYSWYRGDVTDGIVVRIGEQGGESSKLLFMNTSSTYLEVFGQKDWEDPALPVGNSYTDPETGITLNLISTNGNSAEVYISTQSSVSSGACDLYAPMLTLSNGNGQTAPAGSAVDYQLTIENVATDSQCDPQQFEILADLESGWSAETQSVTLAPGESSTVTMTVTSDQNATDGDHNVTVQAYNVSNSSYTTSVKTVYTVSGGNTGELIAQDDSVTISSVSPITIDVLANDIVTDPNMVSIVSTSMPSKGNVEILSDGRLQYTPANRFKNSDSFTYSISSNGMTSTATVYIQLQSSSSSTGSKGKGKIN